MGRIRVRFGTLMPVHCPGFPAVFRAATYTLAENPAVIFDPRMVAAATAVIRI
jgi:hypothetical protein